MVGLRGVGVAPGVVWVVGECRCEWTEVSVEVEMRMRVWVWECVCAQHAPDGRRAGGCAASIKTDPAFFSQQL